MNSLDKKHLLIGRMNQALNFIGRNFLQGLVALGLIRRLSLSFRDLLTRGVSNPL